jgi:hypothetical protein
MFRLLPTHIVWLSLLLHLLCMAHVVHDIVELGLYLPTAHRVHVVAPGDASVLVTLPALHVMQVALPAIG